MGLIISIVLAPITLPIDLVLNIIRSITLDRTHIDAPWDASELVDHATVSEWVSEKLTGDKDW